MSESFTNKEHAQEQYPQDVEKLKQDLGKVLEGVNEFINELGSVVLLLIQEIEDKLVNSEVKDAESATVIKDSLNALRIVFGEEVNACVEEDLADKFAVIVPFGDVTEFENNPAFDPKTRKLRGFPRSFKLPTSFEGNDSQIVKKSFFGILDNYLIDNKVHNTLQHQLNLFLENLKAYLPESLATIFSKIYKGSITPRLDLLKDFSEIYAKPSPEMETEAKRNRDDFEFPSIKDVENKRSIISEKRALLEKVLSKAYAIRMKFKDVLDDLPGDKRQLIYEELQNYLQELEAELTKEDISTSAFRRKMRDIIRFTNRF